MIKMYLEKTVLEEITDPTQKLMTQARAAETLGMTVGGVRMAMNRGSLPVVRVEGIKIKYTLQSGVEAWKAKREE